MSRAFGECKVDGAGVGRGRCQTGQVSDGAGSSCPRRRVCELREAGRAIVYSQVIPGSEAEKGETPMQVCE